MDFQLKRARIGRNVRRVVNTLYYLWKMSVLALVTTGLVFIQMLALRVGDFERVAQTAWVKPVIYFAISGVISFGLLLLYLRRRERKRDQEEIFFHRFFSRDLYPVLSAFEEIVDETWTEEKVRSRKQEIMEWRPATLKVPDEERQKEIERRVWILNPPEGTKYLEEHPLNEEFLRIEERLNDSYILYRMKDEILALPNEEQEALLRFFVLREVRNNDLKEAKEKAQRDAGTKETEEEFLDVDEELIEKLRKRNSLVPLSKSKALQRIAGEFENLTDDEWTELLRMIAERDGKDGPSGNALH